MDIILSDWSLEWKRSQWNLKKKHLYCKQVINCEVSMEFRNKMEIMN